MKSNFRSGRSWCRISAGRIDSERLFPASEPQRIIWCCMYTWVVKLPRSTVTGTTASTLVSERQTSHTKTEGYSHDEVTQPAVQSFDLLGTFIFRACEFCDSSSAGQWCLRLRCCFSSSRISHMRGITALRNRYQVLLLLAIESDSGGAGRCIIGYCIRRVHLSCG